jgi:serine/threonine protein kinase
VLRDFKPANLVVDAGRRVRIIDVGSCRVLTAFHSAGDPVRIGSGKWRHWAPEQLVGFDEPPSPTIDCFSVASTVAWCATGTSAYTNQERAADKARVRYLEEWRRQTPRIRERLDAIGVPREVAEFVVRSLHPRARDRPTEIPAW